MAVPAFAAGPGVAPGRPAVVGTVASISGNTLTVTSRPWRRGPNGSTTSPTTYTVNASGAIVVTDGKSSSVSSIAVGDFVAVHGSVSGTDVTATDIRDSMRHGPRDGRGPGASSTRAQQIQGNGEPVIGGTVSAVSGSTLTVTAKAGQTYTVNAANAKIVKRGVTNATLSNLSAGDAVVVQGAVNGTSVTASSILDQAAAPAGSGSNGKLPLRHGFFGRMGGFFTHLFGFF